MSAAVAEPAEIALHLPRLHVGQERIRRTLKRYNHCRMGRRWGKTVFGLDYLIDDHGGIKGALEGAPVAWFAPTNKMLGDAWRDAKRLLSPLIRHKDERDKRIELVTNGILDMWSMEPDDPARGRKYAKVVVDEASVVRNMLEKWQQAISPTLTDYRGGAFFSSTPKGRNDFWKLEQLARATDPKSWAFFHAPTSENPYIHSEEIEAKGRELPSLIFRQEYLAEYVDLGGGLVKPEWMKPGAPPIDFPVVLGVDLAISTDSDADFTAIVALSRDRGGNIYVLGAYRFRGTFNKILEQITMSATRYKPIAIAIENNQFQTAVVQELLRTTKLPVRGVRSDKDKYTAFLPLAARYEQGLIYHGEGLPPYFADEIVSFTGAKDDHDDMVDALRIAFNALPATGISIVGGGQREAAN